MTDDCNKHHVVHLIGSTGLYGAERWILALLRAIESEQTVSTIVNLMDDRHGASEVVAAARQRGLNAVDFFTGGSFNPLLVFRLARWLRQRKVTILHGHGFKSDVVGLLTARLAGCKIMTTPHGWSFESDRKLQFYEWLDKVSFRFMDMVCPLSSDLEEGLKGIVPARKLRMILNGVDVDEVRSAASGHRADDGVYTIGYIGQLIDRKDLKTLLQAVRLVCHETPGVVLKVIGDGAQRAALEKETESLGLAGSVEFLGFRPDAVAFLKTFDLFVLPSLMEGIPRCIMEAMAAGIPVVVSDIPGNRTLVTSGETGLLFSPGDSDGLAEAIKSLIENPAMAKAMALCASRAIDEKYSNRRMANQYEKLYLELLGG